MPRSRSRSRSKRRPMKDLKLEICSSTKKEIDAVKRFAKTKTRKIVILDDYDTYDNCIVIKMPTTSGNITALLRLEKKYHLKIINLKSK